MTQLIEFMMDGGFAFGGASAAVLLVLWMGRRAPAEREEAEPGLGPAEELGAEDR